MDCYIIRNKQGDHAAIYHRDGNIYYRESTDDAWTYPEIIGAQARPNFTISAGKEPIVVYQTEKGDIAAGVKGHKPKVLLESNEDRSLNMHYIPYENGARLIYSSHDAQGYCLTELHKEGKSWSSPVALDSYIPSTARTVNMGNGNNILFYIKKAPEYQLGYREISPYAIGGFKMLYTSVNEISDFSAAVFDDALHISIVSAGRRNGRVLYIRKDMSGVSRPITLWEGYCEFSVCGIIKNKLHVWWKNPIGVFTAMSYDMGKSFKRPERLDKLKDCRKAGFINEAKNDPDRMVFNDMLVGRDKVYEALLI